MLSFIQQVFSGTTPTQVLQTAPKIAVQKTIKKQSSVSASKPKPAKEESIETRRIAKLIMVTSANNNKFYDMRENTDGTFTVTYGRVGSAGTQNTYSIGEWNSKYKEKIRKGYKDQTRLFANVVEEEATKHLAIDDATVEALIQELMRCARKSIRHNYMVSAEDVTRQQVAEAQAVLDSLVARVKKGMRTKYFNDKLLELYQVIPRRMSHVKDHLISKPKTEKDYEAIRDMLAKEQDTLDVMRGQVDINEQQKEDAKTDTPQEKMTLLEAMGIQIEPVDSKELTKMIKRKMGADKDKFKRAYKVINLKTQQDFDKHLETTKNKKTELFWHGSRNENWMSIMTSGLVLRPANAVITGKMFGYGLYFADKFKKSLNYTSHWGAYWTGGTSKKAFLALYDVHVGKQLKIKDHGSWCYELNEKNLKKRGKNYDSLFAEGGADLINNEYIVYNQAQSTIRYLIEIS